MLSREKKSALPRKKIVCALDRKIVWALEGENTAAAESEALVEAMAQVDPVAQLGVPVATAGPSRLLNIPAGLEEASTNERGVRESVTSETDEPPSLLIRTRVNPS